MKSFYSTLLMSLVFSACSQNTNIEATTSATNTHSIINQEGTSLQTRINPEEGYERLKLASNSFGNYLRPLPIKPHGTLVKHYDGSTKNNYNVYEAVIDLPIGKRDLHQCADAVMRLKAEYHWRQEEYDKIHFNFTNGFRVDYKEWMKGKRIIIDGNKTYWSSPKTASNTYKDFWKYMEIIFSYAGTLSLSKELKAINVSDMQIGDVFIQGGSPEHAILVIDMTIHPTTDKKQFLLAQSYMPAQETQILKNPNNPDSPWYDIEFGEILQTPEWIFYKEDLKRFSE